MVVKQNAEYVSPGSIAQTEESLDQNPDNYTVNAQSEFQCEKSKRGNQVEIIVLMMKKCWIIYFLLWQINWKKWQGMGGGSSFGSVSGKAVEVMETAVSGA